MKLSVIGYGHTVCWPEWGFQTSGEAFQRVYYVLGGTCRCTIYGRTFPLKKGHLYVLPLHVPYAMEHDPQDPLYVLWQHVRFFDRDTGPGLVCRPVDEGSAVWHVLEAMAALSRGMMVEHAEGSGDLVAGQLQSLSRSLFTVLECTDPLFVSLDPRIAQVLRSVAEHPEQHYTVQDLAQTAKLERSHFSRLFRAQLRVPAQVFLIRARLDYAAQILMREGSVGEAAAAAGYADAKAFSRAFSTEFGISPAQYRKYHVLQP